MRRKQKRDILQIKHTYLLLYKAVFVLSSKQTPNEIQKNWKKTNEIKVLFKLPNKQLVSVEKVLPCKMSHIPQFIISKKQAKPWNPAVNFTNILQAAFTHSDPKSAIKLLNLTVFLHFWDLRA